MTEPTPLERLREVFDARAFAEDGKKRSAKIKMTGINSDEEENKWVEKLKERFYFGLDVEAATATEDEDPDKNFLIPWLKKVEILEAEKTNKTTSRIVYRFPVLKEYLNPTRTFHGGAIASIMDVCTTWCLFLICDYGFWSTMGTTRSLHCVYLKPAMEDEMLLCECRIVHAGKRLCLLTGSMTREKDGAVVATCEHNKYNIDADSSNM